jgi:hypothetical protein
MSGGAAHASPTLAAARPQVAHVRPLAARRARLTPTDRRQPHARPREAPVVHTQQCVCPFCTPSPAQHAAHCLLGDAKVKVAGAAQQYASSAGSGVDDSDGNDDSDSSSSNSDSTPHNNTSQHHNTTHNIQMRPARPAQLAQQHSQPARSARSARPAQSACTARPARPARSAQTGCSLACAQLVVHVHVLTLLGGRAPTPQGYTNRDQSPYPSGLYKMRSGRRAPA